MSDEVCDTFPQPVYVPSQQVTVLGNDELGIVVSIQLTTLGQWQYQVQWWEEGNRRVEIFEYWELAEYPAVEDGRKIGFKQAELTQESQNG